MNSLSIPNNYKGYTEEMIILDGTSELLSYSLSNNLDDIKIAIYARTGQVIKLEKAYWRINTDLSVSVKHLMKTNNVIYSMTICDIEKVKTIIINMSVGNKWFITGYDKTGNKYLNWETVEKINLLQKYNAYIRSDEEDKYSE